MPAGGGERAQAEGAAPAYPTGGQKTEQISGRRAPTDVVVGWGLRVGAAAVTSGRQTEQTAL